MAVDQTKLLNVLATVMSEVGAKLRNPSKAEDLYQHVQYSKSWGYTFDALVDNVAVAVVSVYVKDERKQEGK